MGRVKRATKLYNKNHLSDDIGNRRKVKSSKAKFVGKRGTRAISGQTAKIKGESRAGTSAGNEDGAGTEEGDKEETPANFWEGDDDNSDDDGSNSDVSSDGDLPSGDEGQNHDSADAEESGNDNDDGDDDDDEMIAHQKALERLAEKDPEFYQHLQQNEKDLLNFEDDEEEEEDNEEEGAEDEHVVGEDDDEDSDGDDDMDTGADRGTPAASGSEAKEITSKMISAWRKKLETTKSVGVLRDVLTAFRAACNVGVENDTFNCRYKITSSHVFDQVMSTCLESVVDVLDSLFDMKAKPGMEPALPSTSNKWTKYKSMVKSYVGNLVVFLGQATDGQMIGFVLSRVERAARYIVSFPKLLRQVLKRALETWSTGEDVSRVPAFLVVRRLAATAPFPFIDQCLKGIYMSYVAVAKYVTPQNLSRLTFMENCIVDLYGLDHASSYQKAFMYIRQLAIHLRNAISMKKKDGYTQVYNWQFIRCLVVWGRVLGEHAGSDMDAGDLSPLVYPLVQVVLGTARLVPSAKFLPLRLVCMQVLNDLCTKTVVYVPTSAIVLDVLETVHNKLRTAKGSTEKMVDPACTLKTPKQLENSRRHNEALADRALGILLEHLSIHAYSIAFPELALPTLVHLKRLAKQSKDVKFKKQLKQMVRRIEENITYISSKRDQVNFSPKDFKQIAAWVKGEEGQDKGPLRRYFRQWKAVEEAQTHTVRTANEGRVQDGKANEAEDDGDDMDVDSGDENEMDEEDEEGEEEEEEEEVVVAKRKSKRNNLKKNEAPVTFDDDDDEADTVTAFDFSKGF